MGDETKVLTAAPAEGVATPELYPGHAAELARKARRDAATAVAGADPLPGPLLEAFAAVPETIAGLTVRPLVHFDFVILRRLESPLLRQLAGQTGTPFNDEQGYEMVLQFTRPVREMAALSEKGAAEFRRVALDEIGMALGPVEVALLVKAVEREFLKAFSTVIKYSARPAGEGDGTVFTKPPAGPMTGSAGGSTISAG